MKQILIEYICWNKPEKNNAFMSGLFFKIYIQRYFETASCSWKMENGKAMVI